MPYKDIEKEREWNRNYARRPASKARRLEYERELQRTSPEKVRAKRRRVRAIRQADIDSLKRGSPCLDCGNIFPPECMDWDHLPGTEKCFHIGEDISRNWKSILQEIEKCQLVCANCHRIRTRQRRKVIPSET